MPSISSLPAVGGTSASPTVEQTMLLLQGIASARGEIRLYLGASEFGVLLATIFYGANLVQLYVYATAQRRDPLWVILLVIWVWALDTCHTGFIWSWLFDKTVLDSADISRTLHAFDLTNALAYSVVFSGLIGASVQCFYAYRLARLARHPWFSIVSWLGSLARAALSVAVAFYARKSQTLLVFVENNRWLIHGILGLSVAVDVFNTSIVCVLLARHKDGMELTSTMISKLTLWTIETGVLTSACALVMLCLELVGKPSTITALLFLYAKLFAFSLLVTLNGRERLRNAIASGASMVSGGALSPSRPAVVSVTHHREFKEPGFELVSRPYRVDDPDPFEVKDSLDAAGTPHPDIKAVAPWEGIDPVVPRSQRQTLRPGYV